MKPIKLNTILVSIIGALALNLALPAIAEVSMDDAKRFVKMFDSNKDGMVSKAEMMTRMNKMLATVPTDKAGMVDEMRTLALLLELKRGDGNPTLPMITKEEMMARMKKMLDTVPTDKAGMIDEMKTLALLLELKRGDGNPTAQMISKEMLMKKVAASFDKMDADKQGMLDAKRTMELLAELMRSPG